VREALGRVPQDISDPLTDFGPLGFGGRMDLGPLGFDGSLHPLPQVVWERARANRGRGRIDPGLGRAAFALRQRAAAAFLSHTVVPPAIRTAGGGEPHSTAQHTTYR
jgi:hypothetical protein